MQISRAVPVLIRPNFLCTNLVRNFPFVISPYLPCSCCSIVGLPLLWGAHRLCCTFRSILPLPYSLIYWFLQHMTEMRNWICYKEKCFRFALGTLGLWTVLLICCTKSFTNKKILCLGRNLYLYFFRGQPQSLIKVVGPVF